jgi:hypothetical protein
MKSLQNCICTVTEHACKATFSALCQWLLLGSVLLVVWLLWYDVVFYMTGYAFTPPSCEEGFMLFNNAYCVPNTTEIHSPIHAKGGN